MGFTSLAPGGRAFEIPLPKPSGARYIRCVKPIHASAGGLFSRVAFLLCLVAPLPLPAQLLVYRLELEPQGKALNFHFFEAGYFVAPLLGGTGTFLLSSRGDRRGYIYSVVDDAGQLFAGVERDGDTKAVLASSSTSGTARTGFFAIGDVNFTLKTTGPQFKLSARVAKQLAGVAFAADDESAASAPASDGSVGMGGMAELKVHLEETWTKRVNSKGYDLDAAVDALAALLESRGYTEVTGPESDEGDQ